MKIAIKIVYFIKFLRVGEDVKKQMLFILTILFILLGIMGASIGIEKIIMLIAITIIFILIAYDYQIVTYAVAGFPFIDYLLRIFMPSFAIIWDELLFIIMIVIWAYKYAKDRNLDGFKQTPLDMPILLFIGAMFTVLIFNSSDFTISLEGFRATIQYMLWYFVVIQILKDKNGAKRLCTFFVIIVGIMSIHGVYQYIVGVETPAQWTDSNEVGVRTRVFSILTSPNILGSLMTLTLPLSIALGNIAKSNKTKALFYMLTLTMGATLVFTFSRGAWLGFGACIVIYIFLKDKRLFIPFIIIGIIAIILVPGILNRILYLISPEYIESSLRGGRLIRWITGLKILGNSPVFGVGLGQFGGAVAMNHDLSILVDTELTKTFYMDNYYLKTAVETGLFGFIAFIGLMYQMLLNGIRTIRITKDKQSREIEIAIVAGLFGVIIHNFVENVFEVPMMTSCFWLLVAILMHFWYINYNDKKKG